MAVCLGYVSVGEGLEECHDGGFLLRCETQITEFVGVDVLGVVGAIVSRPDTVIAFGWLLAVVSSFDLLLVPEKVNDPVIYSVGDHTFLGCPVSSFIGP